MSDPANVGSRRGPQSIREMAQGIQRIILAKPTLLTATAMLSVLSGAMSVSAQAPVKGEASAIQAANVTVDFSRSRGKLLRTERYNTWDNGDPVPELRTRDIAFLKKQGLHSQMIRVGIKVDTDVCDLKARSCDFSKLGWLSDVSGLTDSLVVHLTPAGLFEQGHEPADLLPLLTLAVGELKRQFPNVDYIEAFNEPDWVDHVMQVRKGEKPRITPDALYRWYVPFYQAVNKVNAGLAEQKRIRVGGPTLMSFDHKGWISSFLAGFAADPNPDKRLDFVSWHGYGYFDEKTGYRSYVFFKDNPTLVADQRARLDAMLKEHGIAANIPALVTETGIYPGPAFDERDPSKNDWSRQPAGMASLHYWYAEQPNIYPFNWTVRHSNEGRKDQLVTLRGEGAKSPPDTFTPYGNLLRMETMLRDERVVAQSDALTAGKGVYAIATRGNRGGAIMIWNYQGTGTKSYRVNLSLAGLPRNAAGHFAVERQYRIDQNHSNYWSDPAKADLQQVSQSRLALDGTPRMMIDLPANAVHLITLDVESDHHD